MLGDGRRRREADTTVRYLDALLAAEAERALDVPADPSLDPAARLAARRLRADLHRFHPSFRFQESLAARLALEAERMRRGLPAGAAEDRAAGAAEDHRVGRTQHVLLQFPLVPSPDAIDAAAAGEPATAEDPPLAEEHPGPIHPQRDTRPLIVGGVASAAISLGAAYVAWRWARPSDGRAMVRAVRAAHAATNAAAAAAATAAGASTVAGTTATSAVAAAGATVTAAATTTSVLASAAGSAIVPRTSTGRAARARGRSVLQGLLGVVA